jgi:type IV pilus assembly protein PilO
VALLPKNQRDQAMVLLVIVAVALVGLYYTYVFAPKHETLTALEARVDALDAANQQAKSQLARGNVDQLRAEALAFQRNLDVMRLLVPTSNEVPALLEQVSTAARRVGLDLASVQPEPVLQGDQFDTYRYKVSIVGAYHPLGEFLANVGSLTRIIAPVGLALTPTNNPQGGRARVGSGLLDARFEIQTYVVKGGSATSRPVTNAAGGSLP